MVQKCSTFEEVSTLTDSPFVLTVFIDMLLHPECCCLIRTSAKCRLEIQFLCYESFTKPYTQTLPYCSQAWSFVQTN
jgi:hypothetical protein